MSQPDTGIDRRKFRRIPKEVPIEIKRLSYPLPEEPGESALGRNLSEGGISFVVSIPYEPKNSVTLKINITGWHGYKKTFSRILDVSSEFPLTAIGEVVWCKKLSEDSEYEVGIKFLDIYEDDYRAFVKYLDDLK